MSLSFYRIDYKQIRADLTSDFIEEHFVQSDETGNYYIDMNTIEELEGESEEWSGEDKRRLADLKKEVQKYGDFDLTIL